MESNWVYRKSAPQKFISSVWEGICDRIPSSYMVEKLQLSSVRGAVKMIKELYLYSVSLFL